MDYIDNYNQMYLEDEKQELKTKRISSRNPYLVFEIEILVIYIQALAAPLLKLKKIGITNESINQKFLELFSTGLINVDYPEGQFLDIITKLYDYMVEARELYISVCKRNNIKTEISKPKVKDPRVAGFVNLVQQGQTIFNWKYKVLTLEEMYETQVFFSMINYTWLDLIELRCFGTSNDETFETLLFTFNLGNKVKAVVKGMLQNIIKRLVENYNNILRQMHEAKKEKYGEITSTKISTSIRPHKAILVSGPNLTELEMLLEATKERGIDIYTHGDMIAAHTYPKLKAYPHLIGHYGQEKEQYLNDFSIFPGAILLTKHSLLSVENFYRGIIYTTDIVSPMGIVKIKDNNFEPLIQSAIHAHGFTETIENPPIKFNFSEKEFLDKITEVAEKIEEGKIKHFFIIELSNHTKQQEEYFDEFLNLLKDDCFVLSFSYSNGKNNVLQVDTYYSSPLIYKALDILTQKISINKLNPIVFYTKCDKNTFPNVLYMKYFGIKKIYFNNEFSPFVNSVIMDYVIGLHDLKPYTNPKDDLKEMLEK